MPESFADLERRIESLEARLRGEGGEPIDLRSLPLTQLKNQMEFDWFPEASKLLEPGSITAKEIGILPAARVWLNGNQGPIGSGVVWPVEYNNIVYDTDNMVAFNTTPAYISPYGAYFQVRTPGIYTITTGASWEASGITAGEHSVGIQWRASAGAAWGVAIAEHADSWTTASTAKTGNASWCGALSEGNQFRAYVFQSSGANQFISSYAPGGRYVHLACVWHCPLPILRTEQP